MAWGYELIIDLYDCNPEKIRNAETIKQYVIELCDVVINMTRYGEPMLVRFGKDPTVTGYSLCQFIEESNITAHFIESTNSIALNIFSCKSFDLFAALAFTQEYFEAANYSILYTERLNR